MKPPNDEGPDLAEGAPGKAIAATDNGTKYTKSGGASQWIERTSPDLVALVSALHLLFPTVALPVHVQRALGHQWSHA